MKSINQLRELLESGKTSFAPSNIIENGNITDQSGIEHSFEITQGWDFGLAMQCDQEWGQFNLQILDFIYDAKPSEQVKLLESSQLEDAHWNWLQKHQRYYSEQYNWFFLIADGKAQAACLVYHPKQSVDTEEVIFYIEFLAVAPWNRPNHISDQQFKGLGSLLLKKVIDYAEQNLGISKGFSLHSLPKAEGYYQKIGMIRFKQHDKDGMGYFEMPESQRHTFLGAIA